MFLIKITNNNNLELDYIIMSDNPLYNLIKSSCKRNGEAENLSRKRGLDLDIVCQILNIKFLLILIQKFKYCFYWH